MTLLTPPNKLCRQLIKPVARSLVYCTTFAPPPVGCPPPVPVPAPRRGGSSRTSFSRRYGHTAHNHALLTSIVAFRNLVYHFHIACQADGRRHATKGARDLHQGERQPLANVIILTLISSTPLRFSLSYGFISPPPTFHPGLLEDEWPFQIRW